MNINPVGMAVKQWCDFMIRELQPYGQAPILLDDTEWQVWGQQVNKLPGVAAHNPPNPQFFSNFYDWAERFNQTVPL